MRATALHLVLISIFVLMSNTGWAAPITSGLALHFDGSTIEATGGDITKWANLGYLGSEGDLTPNNISISPTLSVGANGHNVVAFHGRAGEALQSGAFSLPLGQPNSVFMVLSNTGTNAPVVLDGIGAANRHFLRLISGQWHLHAGTSRTGGSGSGGAAAQIISTRYDQASSTASRDGLHRYTTGATIGNDAMGGIAVGNSPPNSYALAHALLGTIAEVLVYDFRVNNTEQILVDNYLSAKHDISLAANDVYQFDTSHGYWKGVFGVGRADIASAVTNASGAGLGIEILGGLDVGEWITAGYKTDFNSIVFNNQDPQWARVWAVDVTGEVDARLTFDLTGTGLGSGTTEATLLYSATDPFDFEVIATEYLTGPTFSFDLLASQLLPGFYTIHVVPIPEPSTFALLGLGVSMLIVASRRRCLPKRRK